MPIGTRNMVIMLNDIKMKNWMNYSEEEDVHEFFRVMVNYFCINLSSPLLDCSSYFLFCGWMFVWLCGIRYDKWVYFRMAWVCGKLETLVKIAKIIMVEIFLYWQVLHVNFGIHFQFSIFIQVSLVNWRNILL